MKTKENISTIAIIVFSHLCNQTIKTKLQMNKMRENHLTRHLKDEKAAKKTCTWNYNAIAKLSASHAFQS